MPTDSSQASTVCVEEGLSLIPGSLPIEIRESSTVLLGKRPDLACNHKEQTCYEKGTPTPP